MANTAAFKVPSYTMFDGVVDYERDSWSLALNVTNIGDEIGLKCADTC